MEAVVYAEMFIPMLVTTWHPIVEVTVVLFTVMKTSDLHKFHL